MKTIQMQVVGVALDSRSNMPIVLLRDRNQNQILPIWIGIFEAQAILFALEGIRAPRPLTHDLLRDIISGLKAEVESVVINALKDNTYFAIISLKLNGKRIEIDSRPSDAIAIALRAGSPIFVTEPVINATTMPQGPIDEEEIKRFKEGLKDFKLGDLQ
ncbi:bifunctional nuclease family protein [bacterium]|nr:bifunctional nuclease family protein [bacterium]MBU1615187.1 bifunctional nuclease family protein [bacterium]